MSASDPEIISGIALLGEDLTPDPVDLVIRDGTIVEIEQRRSAPELWICPAFFNAHTHLGDTIAMDCGDTRDLVSLVTPPDGLKHRILKSAARTDLVAGMSQSIRFMAARGTAGCADFREGGVSGVRALQEAAGSEGFRTVIFGREGGESVAGGLGISSTRDVGNLDTLVAAARRNGKLIAFHAGERDPMDVDSALAYDPDLIIHATHATRFQIRRCAEENIPIVLCPRSNWALSVTRSSAYPPVRRMLKEGCRLYLGTDNVMLIQPDILSEMAFLHTVYHAPPTDILRMAVGGSAIGGDTFFIRQGARANFFTIDPRRSNLSFAKNPVTGIVNRAFSAEICKNVFNS